MGPDKGKHRGVAGVKFKEKKERRSDTKKKTILSISDILKNKLRRAMQASCLQIEYS